MALNAESVEAFYAGQSDPDAAAAALAASLGIENHTTDSRGGAKLDTVTNTLLFSRDAGFTLAQTLVLHDVTLALLTMASDPNMEFAAAEAAFQAALVAKVTATPTEGCFTVDDVRVVSEHFAHGYFAHFKLYGFMYSEVQAVDLQKKTVHVETAFAFAPLTESLPAAAYEEKVVRDTAAAAAAVKAKEENEARKAAEEAELAKRKPKTLDEAVERAVQVKVALEKVALEAEYSARERQLLEKIAVLEQQMGAA